MRDWKRDFSEMNSPRTSKEREDGKWIIGWKFCKLCLPEMIPRLKHEDWFDVCWFIEFSNIWSNYWTEIIDFLWGVSAGSIIGFSSSRSCVLKLFSEFKWSFFSVSDFPSLHHWFLVPIYEIRIQSWVKDPLNSSTAFTLVLLLMRKVIPMIKSEQLPQLTHSRAGKNAK